MKTLFSKIGRVRTGAFTLIEVVLALGVVSFSLVSVMGLFSAGLEINKESADQIQAANLASLVLSTRRAMPSTQEASLPLPILTGTTTVTGTSSLAINGMVAAGKIPASDQYSLFYQISPGAAPNMANVYLLLWWPAGTKQPTGGFGNYYEISTQVSY